MIRENEDWVTCGKTIRQLIEELQTFEDLDVEVRISIDDGATHKPISMVGNELLSDGTTHICLLEYAGE